MIRMWRGPGRRETSGGRLSATTALSDVANKGLEANEAHLAFLQLMSEILGEAARFAGREVFRGLTMSKDGCLDVGQIVAEVLQESRGVTVGKADKREKQVLGAD